MEKFNSLIVLGRRGAALRGSLSHGYFLTHADQIECGELESQRRG
jgi:hypothetical protein